MAASEKYFEAAGKSSEASKRYLESSKKYPESSKWLEASEKYAEASKRYYESSEKYSESSQRYIKASEKYIEASNTFDMWPHWRQKNEEEKEETTIALPIDAMARLLLIGTEGNSYVVRNGTGLPLSDAHLQE